MDSLKLRGTRALGLWLFRFFLGGIVRRPRAPETGALVLAGRKLTSGDIVSAREFETLVYDPQGAAPGAIELIGYAALDAFGQSTQGVAAIAVGAGEAGKARLARGSGLGIPILYNIVSSQLQGSIHCESTPGVGTTFYIRMATTIEDDDA